MLPTRTSISTNRSNFSSVHAIVGCIGPRFVWQGRGDRSVPSVSSRLGVRASLSVRASSREHCNVRDGNSHHLPMAARTPTGEWCSPTREITTTHLVRLIDESRPREAVVEAIDNAPPPERPAAALELLERPRCNTRLIDPRSLADPDAPATGREVAALDPGPAMLRSEPEVEQGPATPVYAPTTKNKMPPAAAPAQSIATGARRGGKHSTSIRLILGLGVLVLLCLWGVVFFGLDI